MWSINTIMVSELCSDEVQHKLQIFRKLMMTLRQLVSYWYICFKVSSYLWSEMRQEMVLAELKCV